jgi:ubiquinone/menaquinone biosynthesis C-methylase UbiE
VYGAVGASAVLRSIWREVYRDDYPADAGPFSFVTIPELCDVAAALNVGEGRAFVDVACGEGGPGLFIAEQTRRRLIGIDFSRVGLRAAVTRARARGLANQSSFVASDAMAIALGNGVLGGAICIDALQLVRDRSAVLSEVARILAPGARFVFTTWLSRHGVGPPFPRDYEPLLVAHGFAQESCRESVGAEARESEVFARIMKQSNAIRREVGEATTEILVTEAAKMVAAAPLIRRVTVVARRA